MRIKAIFMGAGLVWLSASTGRLAAQPAPRFGVDTVSSYVIGAYDLDPIAPAATTFNNLHRYLTSGGFFFGEVHLPQGAQILSMELESCDTSTTGRVSASLGRIPRTGSLQGFAFAATSQGGAPGCGTIAEDLAVPETIHNENFRYTVSVQTETTDGKTTVGAVRIYYRLQVSPAPGTATFNDVPTSDPAFQFIEALVTSGVTAGCGSGNYCPNAPLTRRQMAVFLAKLLGLQWPDGPPL